MRVDTKGMSICKALFLQIYKLRPVLASGAAPEGVSIYKVDPLAWHRHKSTWSIESSSRCFVFNLPILQAGDLAFRRGEDSGNGYHD
jgi:hypothetical protein